MTNFDIRPFEPNDYEMYQGREFMQMPYALYPDLLARSGPALTAVLDGAPVACGGLVRVWPGTAEGWMKVSPSATAVSTMLFHRKVRQALRFYAELYNLHRVQTYIDPHYPLFHRWARALGFEQEAYLRQWCGNRQDMMLYTWFPKGIKDVL